MARRKKSAPILITGASGFLGLHLVAELRRAGHQVRSLSLRACDLLEPWEVEQHVGSVVDPDDCRRAVDGVSAVYHLAGFVSRDAGDQGLLFDVHVAGTRNVLTAARDAGVTRVCCVTTSGTVGVGEREDFLATERSPVPWDLIRGWPYYTSKAYAEKEIAAFVAAGLPVKIARPTLLLGPGDHTGSSNGDVVRFLCGDVKAALPGGVSVVDARDVAAVLPALMDKGAPGVGYLLTAANLTVKDFLISLGQVCDVRPPALTIPRAIIDRAGGALKALSKLKALGGVDAQTFEMGCRYWYVDNRRAVEELGFAPRPLAETLRETIADLRPGLPG